MIRRELIATLEKAPDLEARIYRTNVDGVTCLEFRDFIPSQGKLGRGYWLKDGAFAALVANAALKDRSVEQAS